MTGKKGRNTKNCHAHSSIDAHDNVIIPLLFYNNMICDYYHEIMRSMMILKYFFYAKYLLF